VTASESLNIPPPCPTREDLRSPGLTRLVEGRGGKADVLLSGEGARAVVIKDFAGRGFLSRWLGRLQVAREARAYGWLQGLAGVPRFVGRIDAWALAVESVEGRQLAFVEVSPQDGRQLHAKLREIVDSIHARGVVHNDLRGRENVLLRPGGELAVIDFAAAVRLKPGGIAHRLLFRLLAVPDEAALLKWKGMLAPDGYTAEEVAFLRRFERWRALWPFNPKRRKGRAGTA
jgi:hypothetical protein